MAQQPNDNEPVDGLINYNDIHNYEDFQKTFSTSVSQLHHIWTVHWEIAPESAESMMNVVADMMKAFGSTYHRGIEEGWIPKELQYYGYDDGRAMDIHENQ